MQKGDNLAETRKENDRSCDGRVVKVLDSESNGIFLHRFEPCSQRHCLIDVFFFPMQKGDNLAETRKENGRSCDGRVVKALDSKSNGIFPHRFEPCSQRVV